MYLSLIYIHQILESYSLLALEPLYNALYVHIAYTQRAHNAYDVPECMHLIAFAEVWTHWLAMEYCFTKP